MPSTPASVVAADHQTGDVIAGRYVLRRKLGEGGMGVVWVAHSNALDVDVALKMLRREIAGTEAVERMAREARTAAQLGHPAMVRVIDFGTSERGAPFLAMELLQGEELHSMLVREQRIPAERAAALLLPIIDGLAVAHEKGIVHRDIKPENIFIATDGQGRVQPKVLDFGIAKLNRLDTSSRLTQVGAVMGSPQYLSPEQAEGLDDVDFRSDIWSVGVLLYELVTGTPPFEANNYNALIRSILRNAPRPTTELAAGDAQFWTIIERCLKKDPGQRWGSMWELGEALALWLFERGVRVDAASRSLRHGWLESGVTGLQILVTSEPPDAPTLPPPVIALEGAVPSAALSNLQVDIPTLSGSLTRPIPRPRQRRPWLTGILVGVVVAAVLSLVVIQIGRRSGQHTAPDNPPRAALAPEEHQAPAVAEGVVDVVPALQPLTPPDVPPAPAPTPSAEPTPSAPTAAVRPALPANSASRAATVSLPRKASTRKGLNTEFGF